MSFDIALKAMREVSLERSGPNENGRDYIRWCFADPAIAEAFAATFANN